ncbi:MAG: hypothetical protein JWO78_813 [Micavibrio sp.]|nr:hypothetical protein [Micavibrio sp.]
MACPAHLKKPERAAALRFLILATALILSLFCTPSQAEDYTVDPLQGFTMTDKVGFAFYRLINRDPPYLDWIKARDAYKEAVPKIRMDMLDHEQDHLRIGFANYQLDRDLIMIKAPLLYTIIDNPDYSVYEAAREKSLTKRLQVRMPDNAVPYFPFQLGKMWIGVAPKDMEQFAAIDMTDLEFKALCIKILDCSNFKNKTVPTTIMLKALQADTKKPLMEGDLPVFVMLSDVAALYVRGSFGELLWSFTAPWYFNNKSQELMVLHK